MTDILEFARLESASLDPERKSVRLQSMFQQIDVRFEDIAVASNVDLRIRATPVSLCTDASMVVRILENLVSNAIKFTRARVLLTARRRGSELYVEVRDQGPGVPPDSIDKVFDAFYQGQDTRESSEQGVGLGLAIVKRLADALGYRMEVVSRPGRGTLMRLVIPGSDLIE
jgi:signal transduction histidine kinase